MKHISKFLLTLATAALLGSGCESNQKAFKVTSDPSEARIYLDGKLVGQTPFETMLVTFNDKGLATLQLKKDGYQPEGIVLSMEDREELFFPLKDSPQNKQIIEILTNIQRSLDQLVILSRTEAGRKN